MRFLANLLALTGAVVAALFADRKIRNRQLRALRGAEPDAEPDIIMVIEVEEPFGGVPALAGMPAKF
jgi:hypothetical protein